LKKKLYTSFLEYFQVVEKSLATYSDDCVKAVKSSADQVETLLKHMIGQRTLNQKFKLCDPIELSVENHMDVANLFETLSDNFAGVVQYNKDNSPHATVNIDDVCAIMVNQSLGPPVTRLAKVNDLIMDKEKSKCLDYKYDNMLRDMQNISWSSSVSNGSEVFILF
jgi:Serine carboxypeptidase S28